jgi:hypothetical protein
MSLIVLELADIFAAAFIQESAFADPVIMPRTLEFLPNKIRKDLLGFSYQFREILRSGLFAYKKVTTICIGQRPVISFAVTKQSNEAIPVLVD